MIEYVFVLWLVTNEGAIPVSEFPTRAECFTERTESKIHSSGRCVKTPKNFKNVEPLNKRIKINVIK